MATKIVPKDIAGLELGVGDKIVYHAYSNVIDVGFIHKITPHGSVIIKLGKNWRRIIQSPDKQIYLLEKSKINTNLD